MKLTFSISSKKNLKKLTLSLVIFLGLFLRFYKLNQTAIFVGDQGRDYLIARDILIFHKLPLIGPQTSIAWIYLGPFFYYFLAFFLWLGNFNPIWPVYGTALFGVLAIYLTYVLGEKFFNQEVGLVASLFWAISPYAILQSRISLHPSILPVFVVLFLISLFNFLTYEYSPGFFAISRAFFGPSFNFFVSYFLLLTSFLVAIQLHLSAILLIPIAILSWEKIRTPRSSRLLKLFLGITMLLSILKLFKGSPFTPVFYWWKIFEEIFSYGNIWGAALALGIVSIGVARVFKESREGAKILRISLLVILGGLTIKNSQAEHYFNLFLPIIILIFSYGLVQVSKGWLRRILALIVLIFFLITNYHLIITSHYFSKIYGPGLAERIRLAKFIVKSSEGKEFILKRCGPLWDYPSTNLNYEYLVWWLGRGRRGDETKREIYYILEPKSALQTMEGCEELKNKVEENNVFEFGQAFLIKKKVD